MPSAGNVGIYKCIHIVYKSQIPKRNKFLLYISVDFKKLSYSDPVFSVDIIASVMDSLHVFGIEGGEFFIKLFHIRRCGMKVSEKRKKNMPLFKETCMKIHGYIFIVYSQHLLPYGYDFS